MNSATAALFTSARTENGKDDWRTPAHVLELVRQVAPIGLDPCGHPESFVHAQIEWTDEGLEKSWKDHGLVFVNPPYSQLKKWADKMWREAWGGVEIIALVPARTDTQAWHQSFWNGKAFCFWRGRINFVGGKHTATFPSALVYWGPQVSKFKDVFCESGKVLP